MKLLLTTLLLASFSYSSGQDKKKTITTIDSIVESITKDTHLTTQSFKIQALKKVLHFISYTYQTKKSIVKIERGFTKKNDVIHQVFFINNDRLIYVTESHVSHYGKDSSVWAGSFYFSNGKLIDYSTLGEGPSEKEDWHPEITIPMAFSESKKDILRWKKSGG